EGADDLVVADVENLEITGIGVAQQHVAGIGSFEIAESDKLKVAPTLNKQVRVQDGVGPEVVDRVCGGGIVDVAQDHVGRGAVRVRKEHRGRIAQEGGRIAQEGDRLRGRLRARSGSKAESLHELDVQGRERGHSGAAY